MNWTMPQKETEFDCNEWCIDQHVTGFNNMEYTSVFFIALALIMMFLYEICEEHDKLKKHSGKFISLAKTCIYIFFFVYFVVIKLRLYYYV